MRLKRVFYLLFLIPVQLITSCKDIDESNVVEEGNYKYFIGSKISFTGTRSGGEFFLCESGLANCECSINLDNIRNGISFNFVFNDMLRLKSDVNASKSHPSTSYSR